jgi:hypothetical protein
MRTLLIWFTAVSCLLAASRTWSIEPLSAVQLDDVCTDYRAQPDNPQSMLCLYYVKGFLDGAVATDGRVAENVAAEIEKEETFTERAIRTRIGNRLQRFGPSVYAEFCVGQPDPIAAVVLHVIEELERYGDLEGMQAQTVVYDTLRRHYPCDAE